MQTLVLHLLAVIAPSDTRTSGSQLTGRYKTCFHHHCSPMALLSTGFSFYCHVNFPLTYYLGYDYYDCKAVVQICPCVRLS